MWIAQHPCGTWCAYEEKPLEKMGGWDGKVVAYLYQNLYVTNWRGTLKEMNLKTYAKRFLGKEYQMKGEVPK